jgi:beta-lactamase regulating signal transducer with metallopeptidase domain
VNPSDCVLWLGLWTIKILAVLAITTVGAAIARRHSASTRHLIWLAGLSTCALIPFAAIVTPRWSAAPVESYAHNVRDRVLRPVISRPSLRLEPKRSFTDSPLTKSSDSPLHRSDSSNPIAITAVRPLVAQPATATRRGVASRKSETSSSPSLADVVALGWFLGIAVCAMRLIVAVKSSRTLRARSHPCAAAEPLTQEIRHQLGISRRVEIRSANELRTPLTFGWLRPVVVLPEESLDWTQERLRSVLIHELAHVRRFDWLILVGMQALACVQWFNPFVWYAIGKLRSEAEYACDDEVILRGLAPTRYASELLQIARTISVDRSPLTVGMARRPQVEARIASILSPRTPRGLLNGRATTKALLLVLAIGLPLAAVRPLLAVGSIRLPHFGKRATTTADDALVNLQPSPSDSAYGYSFDRDLPGGLRVSLMGVSDKMPPYAPQDLWRPEGRPWTGPGVSLYTYEGRGLEGNLEPRCLVFRIQSKTKQDISLFGFVPYAAPKYGTDPNDRNWDTYRTLSLNSGESQVAISSVDFQRDSAHGAEGYALAVGQGPWQTVKEIPNKLARSKGGEIQIGIGRRSAIAGGFLPVCVAIGGSGQQVLQSPMDLSAADWRVVPLDRDGNVVPNQLFEAADPTVSISADNAERVTAFRLETRPWTWVTFRMVSISRPTGDFTLQTDPPHVVLAQNYAAKLPDGLAVTIAGISSQGIPITEDDIWKPDGKDWIGEFRGIDHPWRSSISDDGPAPTLRSLLIQFSSKRARDISITGFAPGVALADARSDGRGWDDYQPSVQLPKGATSGMVGLTSFGNPNPARYYMAVADGPWQFDSEVENKLSISTGNAIQIDVDRQITATVITNPAATSRPSTWTSPSTQVLHDRTDTMANAWRVVPLDLHGNPIPKDPDMDTPFRTGLFNVAKENARKVFKYRLERRPWTWIEFHDLHFDRTDNPSIAIRTGRAVGTSLNATADLGDGTAFSVRGIASTRVKRDLFHPSAWWRGDGQLLAPDSSLFDPEIRRTTARDPILVDVSWVFSSDRRDSGPLYLISKVVPGESESKAFTSRNGWTSELVTREQGGTIGSCAVLERKEVNRYATAIAGSASGAWTRQCSIPFHLTNLRPNAAISVTIGMHPAFGYAAVNGKVSEKLPKDIDPVKSASRFVAVDAHGRRFPVLPKFDGICAGDLRVDIGLKDKIGGSSGITLAQVDHFELETCPYRFRYLRKLALQPIPGS